MLVLSRKNNESVVVGGPGSLQSLIRVTVLEIKNGTVRLGFEADAKIPSIVPRSGIESGRPSRWANRHEMPRAM